MPNLGWPELIIIGLAVILLFGTKKLPEAAKGPAFAVAAGLLVYPQMAHLEHFEPRHTRQMLTGTGGYITRVGRWLRESF